jgi:hypothetical protein
MQFKSFMEALKGKQHKIDKNKNGEIDAHDFKLLRKEESELEESEERMARSDYKVSPSGRKSHKEIVFNDAESKDDKKDMKEAKMSDADMAERERIVKGMKKNLSGFKARYGKDAKSVMYATATKQAMKEDLDEALDPSEIAGNPKMYDAATVKKAYYHKGATADDKKSLERHLDRHHGNTEWRKSLKEEVETLEENHLQDYRRYTQAAKNAHAKGDHDIAKAAEEKASKAAANYTRVTGKKPTFNEEVEQIDELSKGTLASYAKKATNSARITQSIGKDFEASANKSRKPGMKDAAQSLADKYKSKSRSREAGVGKAIDRLTKEEFQLDEAMINGREYASHGLMHPDHAAHAVHKVTGNSVDFYAHGTGDKVEGKVIKNDGKAVHIKDTKGTTHKFKVQRGLPTQQNEAKDEQEYGYEGDMAMNQLSTLIRCAEMIKDTLKPDTDLPEWVQSKITLASDYIVTAADYLHSELEEQAPVAPVPDRKYIKGTPEHKAYKATKKPINGMPTNVKESFDADGNIVNSKVSYKEFAMMLEYESKDGVYRNKGTYGGNYVDPEGADDADDKKPKQQPAEKRGRGRPAGAKSGAGKITGTSKLYK